jgi:hypothetical protein
VDGAENCVASGAVAVSVYFCDKTHCGRWAIVQLDVEFARNRGVVLTVFIAWHGLEKECVLELGQRVVVIN